MEPGDRAEEAEGAGPEGQRHKRTTTRRTRKTTRTKKQSKKDDQKKDDKSKPDDKKQDQAKNTTRRRIRSRKTRRRTSRISSPSRNRPTTASRPRPCWTIWNAARRTSRKERARVRAVPPRAAGARLVKRASLCLALLLATWSAQALGASFNASLDQEGEVAPGEPFMFQVTLTAANEEVSDYRPPDFRGLRGPAGPALPSRSTNMQIIGGQTTVENGFSWTYQLGAVRRREGDLSHRRGPRIAVRVGGPTTWPTNPVPVRVGASSGPPRNARRRRQIRCSRALRQRRQPRSATTTRRPLFLRAGRGLHPRTSCRTKATASSWASR